MSVCDLLHPELSAVSQNWDKWRLAYEGGHEFKRVYLKKVSTRETEDDFNHRFEMSYVPRFAAAAIDRVKDSLYMRFCEISRVGGSDAYQAAVLGRNNGVDLVGSSMNSFMGCEILPELLLMKYVGIYVDSPSLTGQETLVEVTGKNPYLYYFSAEEIRSWVCEEGPNNEEYSAVLLKERCHTYDKEFGLPIGTTCRYRYLWKEDGTVKLAYYNEDGNQVDADNIASERIYDLKIKRIPFILLRIKRSLMQDICDYQIALMNLASTDMWYALKANFPFYTESYDPKSEWLRYMRAPNPDANTVGQAEGVANPGEAAAAKIATDMEIKAGPTYGRRFPMGGDRPGFIHPSSEPLVASMQKQDRMMAEIKMLVNLAVAENRPKQQSAESKGLDEIGLQAGLTYIGFVLQQAERKIAEYWTEYESGTKPATVNYPEKYSMPTDAEKSAEVDRLTETMEKVPSLTFKKEIAKKVAKLTVEHDASTDIIKKIESEIESAQTMISDPDSVAKDVENELVDRKTASEARGWPVGAAEKAKAEGAERLARIQAQQSQDTQAARGLPGGDPKSGKDEKKLSQDPTLNDTNKPLVRGEGK
jgi:hypothetical protein